MVYTIEQKNGRWYVYRKGKLVDVLKTKNGKLVAPSRTIKPAAKPKPAPAPLSASIGTQSAVLFTGRTETGAAVSGQGVETSGGVARAAVGGQNTEVGSATSRTGQGTNAAVGTGAANGQWEGTSGGTAVAGHAAGEVQADTVSLELSQCDIHDALRALFRHTKKNYEIDSRISGKVTVSLKDVSLDAAIRSLARAVDATYRVDDGVYVITPVEKSE